MLSSRLASIMANLLYNATLWAILMFQCVIGLVTYVTYVTYSALGLGICLHVVQCLVYHLYT